MAKKEAKTDIWVARQLEDCSISYDVQGSGIKEINKALSTASKSQTGNAGRPEFVIKVGDFVLVIEDKADTAKHLLRNDRGLIDLTPKSVKNYAVNGAVYYAKCIAQKSNFQKVFAIGVSGDETHHQITPVYVDDREGYTELDDVDSFVMFCQQNIEEYYQHEVLKVPTPAEKTTEQIQKDAEDLHTYLRNYGSVKEQDRSLVVAGILLALDEIKSKGFSIDSLTGDTTSTDGEKIYNAIQNRLKRSNVGPDVKRDKMMSEFAIIPNSERLNAYSDVLGKTPLRFYTEFIYEHVFIPLKSKSTPEDYIGRFYGEFMSYSGGDGQSLGIILTPSHICSLFCDLLDVQPDDVVLDPCCGTAGFLIAAMHNMLTAVTDAKKKKRIRSRQLHGFELQNNMFVIACANMILRDDGNSNIRCEDFLKQRPEDVQMKVANIGMMNPPYSQGSKSDPAQYELNFVLHLLDSLVEEGAKAAVIVPQSSMTGKTEEERALKARILKKHTLEGVITCNTNTFYRVGTNPVIAIFSAHEPHSPDKVCKFIDFREDGYEVQKHRGLVETASAKDKKQHLLDVWFGRIKAPTKFCVESTVQPEDEWLHSFYYFNDEIPTEADFEKAVGDYLSFEFSMIMQNRGTLFTGD